MSAFHCWYYSSYFLNGKANWQVQWQIVDATQSKVSYLHKFAPQKVDCFTLTNWVGAFHCRCSLLHPRYKATKVLTQEIFFTFVHQMVPTQQNGCDSRVFAIMVSLLRKHLNISTPLAVYLTLSLTQRLSCIQSSTHYTQSLAANVTSAR